MERSEQVVADAGDIKGEVREEDARLLVFHHPQEHRGAQDLFLLQHSLKYRGSNKYTKSHLR